MAQCYKTPSPRSANLVEAHAEKIMSADKSRVAYGRNYKVSMPDRRYGIVRAWTLKERNQDGKLVTKLAQASEEMARDWVK